MDTLTKEERSHRMTLIRGKDTKPEIIVRSLVHRLGFRFRLHVGSIPGRPDLAFTSRAKVLFVHGCFWHRHSKCPNSRMPKSRVDFWQAKLSQNKRRDIRVKHQLTRLGWRYLVVWECETKNPDLLGRRIRDFLDSSNESS